MSDTIDFYYDFGSPTTYLAHKRLAWIAREYGVTVNYVPVLLGGIFKAAQNQSPAFVPAKAQWMDGDLKRYAKRYNVPMVFNPHFPINTITLMRGAVFAKREGFEAHYVDVLFDAMWVDAKNLGDVDELQQVLTGAGLDANAIAQGVEDPAIKQALKDNTQAALDAGMFGCPGMVYKDELYFGQDRLFFIEEDLAAQQG